MITHFRLGGRKGGGLPALECPVPSLPPHPAMRLHLVLCTTRFYSCISVHDGTRTGHRESQILRWGGKGAARLTRVCRDQ
jgi:hypothetical protein